jgi:hypothetical protein
MLTRSERHLLLWPTHTVQKRSVPIETHVLSEECSSVHCTRTAPPCCVGGGAPMVWPKQARHLPGYETHVYSTRDLWYHRRSSGFSEETRKRCEGRQFSAASADVWICCSYHPNDNSFISSQTVFCTFATTHSRQKWCRGLQDSQGNAYMSRTAAYGLTPIVFARADENNWLVKA